MIIKECRRGEALNSSKAVADLLSGILNMESEIDRDKEHMWIVGVNAKNRVLFVDLCSLGTLTNSPIHPREVFRLAVNRGVASIIAGHNHPSGDPAPSRDDIAVTKRLKDAGEILGIQLLDHVVIGNETGQFYSFREQGVI
jgi:DNA repair protein RadC